ncbi:MULTISPECIES: DNA sulfur modification protein DndB [Streptomyces]|uniref:DNA sulfur modification protein DndB n=1 Tax=Streptomyces TaxID=1883 RepID=UPI00287FC449|nr:DNA sulfur modification protein DndB [Streptomyces sp. CGMCC 4.1456]WNF64916.1 DNA sulfur modification protein DndB [Streptomyces sp. CGMCC 4.1456]
MSDVASFEQALADSELRPTWFEAPAFRTTIGKMPSFAFVYGVPGLVELRARNEQGVIVRKDFDLDDEEPGNRPIDEKHVEKIANGLFDRPDTPIQMITLAVADEINGQSTYRWRRIQAVSPGVEFGMFKLFQGVPAHIENGQHTLEGLSRVWRRVKDKDFGREGEVKEVLARSAAPVQVLIQSDRNEINRIFVVAGQTKPISPALMTALDQSSYANRLGTQVGRRSRLFTDEEDRLVYLRSAAREESLYSTAHVRGFATATLVGFRDRTPELRESNVRKVLEQIAGPTGNLARALSTVVDQTVQALDYAYEKLPGWRDLRRGRGAAGLTPKEFRGKYLHGSPAGLYVIGGVLGAARHNGVSPLVTIEALADLPWERNAQEVRKSDGEQIVVHPMFEGTLVRFEKSVTPDGDIVWLPATAGGARTNYEAAAERVLRYLGTQDGLFKEFASTPTLQHLGLLASARRGRPRKTTKG